MKDQTVRGELIQLQEDLVTSLGPRLELYDCIIESYADARGVIFPGLVMRGGIFEQRVRMSNFHFLKVSFHGVKFKGEFLGCDFGDWDDASHPRISDCDFLDASMHECRFLNCDMATIVTPKWPHFQLRHPSEAREFVMSQAWPKGVGLTLDVYTDTDPECVAVIANAKIIADRSKLPLEQLRSLLETVPGVEIKD